LDRAVIVAASPAGARIAPAANAAVSFELKPGEIVRAESGYGTFLRIRTASGQGGWVSASEVEKIIPAKS
ncbi:MAG: SH3 domain-containing protein, partial [Chthoniobacter sp.]|uniref:SH3 domain-containing protein n=1 Tax=Chthoniobacter sp. TaxID=2510640 RepID=UPI0032A2F4F0